MSRHHHHPQPPPHTHVQVQSKKSNVTRYEREIEKEIQEGGHVATASSFGNDGFIGVWKVGREIGKGASGRVRIARNRNFKLYAAMKIIDKSAPPRESVASMASSSQATATRPRVGVAGEEDEQDDKIKSSTDREVGIMKLIQHPNILQLYDVYESTKSIHLLLEHVSGGELFDRLVNLGRLGADEASQYFQQIISGVSYCHHFNIAHRDLKPENLLIDAHNRVKVADFGLAALQQPGRLLQTSCGSPHYASPEIVSGVAYNGAATDIWSCGVILYALCAGRLPFDDENPRTLLQKVKIGRYHMPADFEPDVKDLIGRMLILDPKKRIKMAEIINHPFCRRRHPDFPPDSLYLLQPPELIPMRKEIQARKGIDRSAFKKLKIILPNANEDELIDSLFSEEETWEQTCYRLLLQYDNRPINGEDPAKYRFFDKDLPKPEDEEQGTFLPHRYVYDQSQDPDHLQDHERLGFEMEYRRGDETPKPRRVRIPSPDEDWELVFKAAERTPSTHGHERNASQAEAARALKRRSSHNPTTNALRQNPELHRRSTVIASRLHGNGNTHAESEKEREKDKERERKVNGPRSPMPKTPLLPQNDNYATPLRSPSPRIPGTGHVWPVYDMNMTPRPQQAGLAPPMADVLKWAAEVPLPLTPTTPATGFARGGNGPRQNDFPYNNAQPRRGESPRPYGYGNTSNAPPSPRTVAPPSPRTRTPGPAQAPLSPRTRTPGPGDRMRNRNSAVVDQDFLDNVQRLTVLDSELESPPFSKLTSSTMRNIERLSTSTSATGLPKRRGSPLPFTHATIRDKENGKGSPTSGGRAKMQNVFRMMKDKENQVPINQYSREPQSAGVQGVEPVLRRKRSVFGGKDKDKEVKPPMPLERKSTYATGAFAAPLDVKFGQNLPGPMEGGNRRPRPAPLNLNLLPKHDLEPSPRLQTPQLGSSPAQTPVMSQLTTPTMAHYSPNLSNTGPRTPLAVVPEAQAKRNWFEKTFSARPPGYYELISTYDCSTTREECYKIFSGLGAAVQVEDSENWGNLVVTQHEVRGVSGQMITRPVKIKLVFIPRSSSTPSYNYTPGAQTPIMSGSGRSSPRPPPSPRSNYGSVRTAGPGGDQGQGTRITFRQEKGTEEGFMAVFEQFRTTWGLDTLRSPGMYGSPFTHSHSPQLSPGPIPRNLNRKPSMVMEFYVEDRDRGLFDEDVAGLGMGIYDRL